MVGIHLIMYTLIKNYVQVEELKEWSIEIIKNNPKIGLEDMSFNYNKVIKPMFRDNKLIQLGIT